MDNKKLKVKDLVSIGVFWRNLFCLHVWSWYDGLDSNIVLNIPDSISHSCRNCCYVIYG